MRATNVSKSTSSDAARGCAARACSSSHSTQADGQHDQQGEPYRAQDALKEPGPRMKRRAIINGKEAEGDEEHQDGDTRAHRVGREVTPLIVSTHASGEHQPSEPCRREGRDGTDDVKRRFRGHAVDHDPRKDASQHQTYPTEHQERNSRGTAARRLHAHVERVGEGNIQETADPEVESLNPPGRPRLERADWQADMTVCRYQQSLQNYQHREENWADTAGECQRSDS